MPIFSSKSLSNLMTCHEDLIILFKEVIKNIDCVVTEGHRDQEKQEAAFNSGNSKLHYPHGKHNSVPSNAVDVYPYPVDMKNISRFYFLAGYVLGTANKLYEEEKISHRIRWGGDFNNNYDITDDKGLIDLPHYELIF